MLGIDSGDLKEEIVAVLGIGKIAIEIFINEDVILKLVDFLRRDLNPYLQLISAWALANVACGTSDQTRVVLRSGVVAEFNRLLVTGNGWITLQAIRGLRNLAGAGIEFPDHLVHDGIFLGPFLDRMAKQFRTDYPDIFGDSDGDDGETNSPMRPLPLLKRSRLLVSLWCSCMTVLD